MKTIRLIMSLVCMCATISMARPTDTLVRVSRDLPAFSEIEIQDGLEVVFTTGEFACTIESKPGNDVYVVTTVNKSVLTVRASSLKFGTKVYLSAPQLERVSINVAGVFTAETPIMANDILFELKGTATMRTAGVRARHVTIRQSGTTNFFDQGTILSTSIDAVLYGVGTMQFRSLGAKNISLGIKGSGVLKVLESVTAPLLETVVNGLGGLHCEGLDVQQTNAVLKGAGIIRLAGKTVSLQSKVAGLGVLNTDNLIIQR